MRFFRLFSFVKKIYLVYEIFFTNIKKNVFLTNLAVLWVCLKSIFLGRWGEVLSPFFSFVKKFYLVYEIFFTNIKKKVFLTNLAVLWVCLKSIFLERWGSYQFLIANNLVFGNYIFQNIKKIRFEALWVSNFFSSTKITVKKFFAYPLFFCLFNYARSTHRLSNVGRTITKNTVKNPLRTYWGILLCLHSSVKQAFIQNRLSF